MLPEIPSSSSSSTDTTSNRNDEVKWTPAGWSEVPWHTYADLATTAAGAADTDTADPDTAAQQQGDGKKQAPSAVLVFSNELGAARAVAREVRIAFIVGLFSFLKRLD
jgi:cytoskeletal protein RodZ